MAQQTINVGTAPNDGTGTPLRTAFQYTNSNFSELYTAVGPSGNNIVVPGSATITGDLTVDTSTLKVDSANNRVGIGTATPATDLHIQSAGTASAEVRLAAAGGRSYNIGSTAAGYGSANNLIIYDITGSAERWRLDANGNHFWNNVGGVAGTAMTLNSTGLGVGATPSERITVGSSTAANYIKLTNSGAATGFLIGCFNTAVDIRNKEAGAMNFFTSDTQRMQIDSAGNVGVGVTPSAWGNYKVLEVGATSSLYNDGGVATDLSNNMYINSSFAYIRKIAAAASRYEQNAGAHAWYNAASSTAGSTISFTQAMTLDGSGNLLVGIASNPNTARAYFRYDTLTTQPVINSASVVAASTSWSHFIGQSGNGSSITTSNIFIYGNGNIQNVNGVYGTISDLRLKENISDARNYLADLLKLRVVKYSLKEEASAVANKLGFIAQEVEQVFPAMVDTDPNDGNKGIKTSVLIPMLVKSIQELTARVQTLEAK
jgi:hypothetical protein